MPADFPSTPTLNQTYTFGDRTWKWNGTGWALQSNVLSTTQLADGSVTTAKLADSNVSYGKIQNVSNSDRLLGRSSAGAGIIEEITCTSAGRALLQGADASVQRTTLGLKTGAITTITTSTTDPTGGTDGDIWIKYTA